MTSQNVSYISVATCAHSVYLNRPPQKKRASESVDSENGLIKMFFSVDLSLSAPLVTNALSVVEGPPVETQLPEILTSLGPKGFKSKGGIDPEADIQSPIQAQASSHQGISDKEWIFTQSPQAQLPAGGIAFPPSETS